MKIFRPLAIVGALALSSTLAHAEDIDRWGDATSTTMNTTTSTAPEIDPAVVGGAVALLAGGTFLVSARRRRNTK